MKTTEVVTIQAVTNSQASCVMHPVDNPLVGNLSPSSSLEVRLLSQNRAAGTSFSSSQSRGIQTKHKPTKNLSTPSDTIKKSKSTN
jgi:hypothetical protein